MQTHLSLTQFMKNRIPSWFRGPSRRSRRSLAGTTQEVLESRVVLSAQTLPVLMVIADQQDFHYKEYNDTRISLEAEGLTVEVAATTTSPSTPHWNSGQGWQSGIVVPDLTLSQVNDDDYSAIVFVGGWGSSMYQSTAFPGNYYNNHYDGDIATKTLVNNLIGEFDAAEKYLGFICHATTIAAWSRVNGVSLIAGKQVSVPYIGSPGLTYNGINYPNMALGQYEQATANGAFPNTVPGQYGVAGTAIDDVVVDGRVITAENGDSALAFGDTIADLVIAAAEENALPVNQAPIANDAVFQIAENAALGAFAGQVVAADPDAGQALTYSIVSGNTAGAFAIDPATGAITVTNAGAIDFETNPVFAIHVQVSDNAADSLSDTAIITVELQDLVEAPPASVQAIGTDLVVQGTSGNDTIYIWSGGNAQQVFVWMNGVNYGSHNVPVGGRTIVSAGDGHDQIFATDARSRVAIFGQNGHDRITGGTVSDILDGGAGVDRIWGMGGDDLIRGGADGDFLDGREGHDIVLGGDGDDSIDGFLGRDILIGGAGWDKAKGGSGEDLLIGGSTSYDQLDAALISLASIWNGAGTASERRAKIQQDNVYQQTGLTVVEDNNLDVLFGGADADLYFSGPGDYVCNEIEDLFAV
jgi:putative intracellular protease/amidase